MKSQDTDYYSCTTTLRAHFFGKIDFLLLFCPEPRSGEPEGGKTTRRNQFCQINVLAKLLKSDLIFQIHPFNMRLTGY